MANVLAPTRKENYAIGVSRTVVAYPATLSYVWPLVRSLVVVTTGGIVPLGSSPRPSAGQLWPRGDGVLRNS